MSDTVDLLKSEMMRALALSPRRHAWEWAEEKRILGTKESGEPGGYSVARVPYSREIQEVAGPRHPAKKVACWKGPQQAITVSMMNVVGMHIDEGPRSMAMMVPVDDLAGRVYKQKVEPLLLNTPALKDKIFKAEGLRKGAKTNNRSIQFTGGMFELLSAASGSDTRTLSAQWIYFDDVDGFPLTKNVEGDITTAAEGRTDGYHNYKIIYVTTAIQSQHSRIIPIYKKSSRARYYVPCLKCGTLQLILPIYLVKEGNDVAYKCPHCQKISTEDSKGQMLREGYWVHGGPVDCPKKDDPVTAGERITEDRYGIKWLGKPSEDKCMGYWISSLYSPFTTWRKILDRYDEAEDDGAKETVKMIYFAEEVTGEGEKPDVEKFKALADGYERGVVPSCCASLVAGVDVQGNRVEVGVFGFAPGCVRYAIDHKVIFGDTEEITSEIWDKMVKYLERWFSREDGSSMQISCTAIDAGFRQSIIEKVIKKYRSQINIIAIKGKENSRARKYDLLDRPFRTDIKEGKRIIYRGISIFLVGSDTGKEMLLSMAARLVRDGPSDFPWRMHFPKMPDEWFEGLLNTQKIITPDGRVGFEKTGPDEVLDCSIYACSAAKYLGLPSWDHNQWEEELAKFKIKKLDKPQNSELDSWLTPQDDWLDG